MQRLGEEELEIHYPHERRGFAGDCDYTTQRHFVDRLRDGAPFETRGEECLRMIDVQATVYRAAKSRQPQDFVVRYTNNA